MDGQQVMHSSEDVVPQESKVEHIDSSEVTEQVDSVETTDL